MDKVIHIFSDAHDALAEIGQGSILLSTVVLLAWIMVKVVDAIDKGGF